MLLISLLVCLVSTFSYGNSQDVDYVVGEHDDDVIVEATNVMTRVDGKPNAGNRWPTEYSGPMYAIRFPVGSGRDFNWTLTIDNGEFDVESATHVITTAFDPTTGDCERREAYRELGVANASCLIEVDGSVTYVTSIITFNPLHHTGNRARLKVEYEGKDLDKLFLEVVECPTPPTCADSNHTVARVRSEYRCGFECNVTYRCHPGRIHSDDYATTWTVRCGSDAQWSDGAACRSCVLVNNATGTPPPPTTTTTVEDENDTFVGFSGNLTVQESPASRLLISPNLILLLILLAVSCSFLLD